MKQLLLQLLSDKIIDLEDIRIIQQNYDNPDILSEYPIIYHIQQLRLINWALKLQLNPSMSSPIHLDSHVSSYSTNSKDHKALLYSKIIELDLLNVPNEISRQVHYESCPANIEPNSNVISITKEIDSKRNQVFQAFNQEQKQYSLKLNQKHLQIVKDAKQQINELSQKKQDIEKSLKNFIPEKYHSYIQ